MYGSLSPLFRSLYVSLRWSSSSSLVHFSVRLWFSVKIPFIVSTFVFSKHFPGLLSLFFLIQLYFLSQKMSMLLYSPHHIRPLIHPFPLHSILFIYFEATSFLFVQYFSSLAFVGCSFPVFLCWL